MAGLNQLLESDALAHIDPGVKKQAWTTAAAAVTHLRARLTEICEAGDQACNAAAASALSDAAKINQLNAVKDRVNSDAAGASRAAVAKIVGVIQQLLDAAESREDASKWLAAQGFNIAEPAPPPPIPKDKLR
ncbi:hypothetical protein [Mycolicibacter longobardus]|uniref:Uncharacterized protein n=1 Tax=Mycolicibacter longobardus TaxID=1108812 RepID=A0A1X1YJG6_9MYCO|nr:hypothetical protein [Mycolicibacter longobardus]MCV7385559.1 hypothetical protein [Mycolicibacter longobardus]ORW11175.1 hypothetical protein AWC16_11370 [Mycolicibacter longobardus]